MKTLNASRITMHTLVGYSGNKFPMGGKGGNCFSVETDGGELRIVNFGMENLEHLISLGLKWPIRVEDIGSGRGVINDGRIGDRWYSDRFCEACCPKDLIPLPQRLVQLRQIQRGDRKEEGEWITCNMAHKPPQFP